MPRYCLLCQHFYPEMISTGMHMTELATELVKLGIEIEVLCGQPGILPGESGEVARRLEYKGVLVERVPAIGKHRGSVVSRGVRGLTYALNTFREIKRRKGRYDGLIVTTNPPFLGVAAALAKRWFGLDYLLITYDVYPDAPVRLGMMPANSPLVKQWERLTRFLMRNAGVIVSIGVDMTELIKAKIRPEDEARIVLIQNWSDDQHVSPVPRAENDFAAEHGIGDRFVVQYSGTMGRTHNVEPVIEAAERFQNDPVLFQFIGEGAKKKKLQEIAEQKGLKNVQFLPFQPIERLPRVLSTSDLSVVCLGEEFSGVSVPSKTYGVMAAERPVLALMSKSSEIGNTILQYDCGYVLEYATADDVEKAIRGAMGDADVRLAKGRRGREAFLAHFTLAQAAAKYADALKKLEPNRGKVGS